MNVHDVIIVGGGLSGLSAAVELSAIGRKVLLLEQRRHCGGRSYSFIDTVSGDCVDNGQHLMMGCYHATRRYLRLFGTEHLAFLQPGLRIEFLHPSQHHSNFICHTLPPPLHLLSGLLGFKAIPFKNRLEMLKVAGKILYTSPSKEKELDIYTVEEWLTKLGQSEISRKYLWDVVTIGTLNDHLQNVSALMLFRVLRAAFLGKTENSSFLIPRVGLSDLFVNPAVRFIETRGGEVRTGVGVESFTVDGDKIRSVQTSDGNELYAKSFISAVPWYAYNGIKLKEKKEDENKIFHSSPMISIQLWLDREVTNFDFAALIETRIHWIFNKTHLLEEKKIGGIARQHLSLIISGAHKFIDLKKEQLVEIAMEDLRSVLPRAQNANVIHSLVIKEKRATFSPYPGLETSRPNAQTKYENLFLAGDWTATGYPATIEGAVMSGKKAAELVKRLN